MRCILSKISVRWHFISTPMPLPISVRLSFTVSKVLSTLLMSTIIIMLKYPCTMVCEMSRMFILFSARYVHTFAIMPTVSFPTTVIIALFIVMFILCCLFFYFICITLCFVCKVSAFILFFQIFSAKPYDNSKKSSTFASVNTNMYNYWPCSLAE